MTKVAHHTVERDDERNRERERERTRVSMPTRQQDTNTFVLNFTKSVVDRIKKRE